MSLRDGDERVEFTVRIKRVTDLAYLCRVDGKDVWFPKSHVDLDESEVSKEGDVGVIVVSEFIAIERGLV